MSTALLTRPARVNTVPKLAAAFDHLPCCDLCGKRVGLVLCRKCADGAADKNTEKGDQLWSCAECGMVRAWGEGSPADRELRPALGCKDCDAVTRHGFLGVAGVSA